MVFYQTIIVVAVVAVTVVVAVVAVIHVVVAVVVIVEVIVVIVVVIVVGFVVVVVIVVIVFVVVVVIVVAIVVVVVVVVSVVVVGRAVWYKVCSYCCSTTTRHSDFSYTEPGPYNIKLKTPIDDHLLVGDEYEVTLNKVNKSLGLNVTVSYLYQVILIGCL